MSDADKRKRLVIESLVLAFANTKAKTMVGTDALRSVLDYRYRELTRGGIFDLGPLLELLEEQPGYEAEPVSAALLRVKSWENRLGIEVKLPMVLAALEETDRAILLDHCAVPSGDLARVLRGGEGAGEAIGSADESVARSGGLPRAKRGTTPPPRSYTPLPSRAEASRQPRISRAAAMLWAAVGVVGLTFAVWYAATHLSVSAPHTLDVSTSFASDIPLVSAERYASQIVAVLRDDAWTRGSAEDRTRQMDAALHKLPSGTTSLVVKDKAGRIRAAAQWLKSPARVVVKLF